MAAGRYPVAYKSGGYVGPGLSQGLSDRLAARGAPLSPNFEVRTDERQSMVREPWSKANAQKYGSSPLDRAGATYDDSVNLGLEQILFDWYNFKRNEPGEVYARELFMPDIFRISAGEDSLTEFYNYHHLHDWRGRGGSFGGGGATGYWDQNLGSVWLPYVSTSCIVPSDGGQPRRYFWEYMRRTISGVTYVWGPHSDGRFTDFFGYVNNPGLRLGTAADHALWTNESNSPYAGQATFQACTSTGCGTGGSQTNTGILSLPNPAPVAYGGTTASTDRYYERQADPNSLVDVPPPGGIWHEDCTVGSVYQPNFRACSPTSWGRITTIKKKKPPTWREAVAPKGSQPSEKDQKEEYDPFQDDWRNLTADYAIDFPGVRSPVPRKVVPLPPPPPTVSRPPNSGRRVRPGKRTKEVKVSLRSHLGPIWIGINMFTETEDLVRALHEALPKGCQEKRWQPSGRKTQARDMLDNIYRCLGQINIAKALEGFINNEIEDWYYANLLGRPGRFINQRLGLYTGGTRAWSGLVGDHLPPPPKVDFGSDSDVEVEDVLTLLIV